jgi:hypothetical protein
MVTLGAYPRRKHLKGAPIGLALALPTNSETLLERVLQETCSSLLGLVVSDKEKSFITLTPGLQHGPHLPVHLVRLQDQVSKL